MTVVYVWVMILVGLLYALLGITVSQRSYFYVPRLE